jgi:hypothetical protein
MVYTMALELEFMRTGEAAVVSLFGVAAVLGGVLAWARRPEQADRRLALGVAVVLTVLIGCIYVLAVAVGWWAGAYFESPIVVQASILVVVTLPGCVLWLAGYQWLTDHTRQPLQICFAVSLLIVLTVAVAHRLNLGQGAILVGPDLAVVWEAAMAIALLWLPILVYEALRRSVERLTLP